jgi:hypothetical protein
MKAWSGMTVAQKARKLETDRLWRARNRERDLENRRRASRACRERQGRRGRSDKRSGPSGWKRAATEER